MPYAGVMTDHREVSIVVDPWIVRDGNQEEFVAALVALMERLQDLNGFAEGQILEGVDPTRFVSWASFTSAQARDEAFIDPQIDQLRRRLGGIAHPAAQAYTVARRFARNDS
jgi:hypothetical protein